MAANKVRGVKGSFESNPQITKWVAENQNKHLCACGCGEFIEIKRCYYRIGITKYIHGHNSIAHRHEIAETVSTFFQTEEGKRQAREHSEFMKEYYKTHDAPTKGKTPSRELVERQSATKRRKYASGEIQPWNKGEKGIYSNETRRRMSEASKARFKNPEDHPRWGTHHTEEAKIQISKNRKGTLPWNAGKKGIYSENAKKKMSLAHGGTGVPYENTEYGQGFDSKLKEEIRLRDGYRCALCGKTQLKNGRQLDVHHADHNKDNHVKENLVSLCKSCHCKTRFNRNKWTMYFQWRMQQ